MLAKVNFSNFEISSGEVSRIYEIGRDDQHQGVAAEMAEVVGHELTDTPDVENLGEPIGKIGPAKELQQNIAQLKESFDPELDAVELTKGWAERSGLLVPVERSYFSPDTASLGFDLAVVTGGVRNWMSRRADRLIKLEEDDFVDQALLVAGNRKMRTAEGPDVKEGMTEADYMETVLADRLSKSGILTNVVAVDSSIGDEVMLEGAKKVGELIDLRSGRIAVVSNAGAWVQNVGQLRRALREMAHYGFDWDGHQVAAVSDGFPLGNGSEPTATHQNPFSAAGQIARNLQELTRHFDSTG